MLNSTCELFRFGCVPIRAGGVWMQTDTVLPEERDTSGILDERCLQIIVCHRVEKNRNRAGCTRAESEHHPGLK